MKRFKLSTGKVITVPGYMENRDGLLYNTNIHLYEALPGDEVEIIEKHRPEIIKGVTTDYTDFQIICISGRPNPVIMSSDSRREGGLKITSHKTTIEEEYYD